MGRHTRVLNWISDLIWELIPAARLILPWPFFPSFPLYHICHGNVDCHKFVVTCHLHCCNHVCDYSHVCREVHFLTWHSRTLLMSCPLWLSCCGCRVYHDGQVCLSWQPSLSFITIMYIRKKLKDHESFKQHESHVCREKKNYLA